MGITKQDMLELRGLEERLDEVDLEELDKAVHAITNVTYRTEMTPEVVMLKACDLAAGGFWDPPEERPSPEACARACAMVLEEMSDKSEETLVSLLKEGEELFCTDSRCEGDCDLRVWQKKITEMGVLR